MSNHNGNPGNKGGGRKGYAYEKAMQYLIDQSFYILVDNLKKDKKNIDEKAKVDKALEVVKKVLGKDIDITSGGKTIPPILVKFINGDNKDEKTNR